MKTSWRMKIRLQKWQLWMQLGRCNNATRLYTSHRGLTSREMRRRNNGRLKPFVECDLLRRCEFASFSRKLCKNFYLSTLDMWQQLKFATSQVALQSRRKGQPFDMKSALGPCTQLFLDIFWSLAFFGATSPRNLPFLDPINTFSNFFIGVLDTFFNKIWRIPRTPKFWIFFKSSWNSFKFQF